MNSLDANAWKVLAELLDLADQEFAHHGCNDYALPNTPENRELVTRMEKWNAPEDSTPEELLISDDGTEIYTMDWFLFGYFAHLAKELAGIE